MAALTLQEVEHIAELAKLQLSDEEKSLYAGQLSATLEYFNRLQQLDTEDVPPMTSVLPLNNVLRDDAAQDCLPTGKLLANAPDSEDDRFRVSAVLD